MQEKFFSKLTSVCGAGGKTTYIEDESKKISKNEDVLVSTTTKMGMPKAEVYDFIILKTEDFEKNRGYFLKNNDLYSKYFEDLKDYTVLENKDKISKEHFIYYFMQEVQIDEKKQKFMHITDELIEILGKRFKNIFIEADGSRRLKLKYPKENEPVISKYTDRYVYVFDMTNIGEKLKGENVYNFEGFSKNMDLKEGETITKQTVLELIEKNAAFKNAKGKKVLLLNKVKDESIANQIEKSVKEKYKDIEVLKKLYK